MKIRRLSKVFWAISGQIGFIGLEFISQWGGDLSLDLRFWMLAPAPFGMYVIWRLFLNPYVKYGEDEVCVNNAFERYSIPYAEISSCGGKLSSLLINTRSHDQIPVHALDASFLGRRKRDLVALELMRRKEESRGEGKGLGRVSTLGFPDVFILGLTVCLFLLATLVSLVLTL
ncbi:hypothetical protein [Streptomyces sp. NBC_01727]|uniref:hypothetical protein n=1 Tax=unclassified Streptomyces TaxID=2593676 RepID=UPI002E152A44|nr:hypothetical protein OIE76_21675 [Streptomyces sp. NBC_01727]